MSDSAGGEPRHLDMIAILHAEGATIPQDLDWLVAEAQRQRTRADHAEAEVTRLRGRLAELEWGWWGGECPACGEDAPGSPGPSGHRDDCWLAAELGR